jgi:putative ABC transport system permease protein
MSLCRTSLLGEIVTMSVDTLRANKLRSGLTVLGVVIGISSMVGMTSLIRGFDESLRDSIRALGPETIFVAKFSGVSFAAGKDFEELIKRPNLMPADAAAIERAPSIETVDLWLGNGGPPTEERVYYGSEKTKAIRVWGTTDRWADVNRAQIEMGRFFTAAELQHRRPVVVLGHTPFEALFPTTDPIGKLVRIGNQQYRVIGVLAMRPTLGSFNVGQDDYVIVPHTAYQKQFGIRAFRAARGEMRSILIAAVPREGVARDKAMLEVQEVMRIRHGLRLDEPNDFDLITQDAALNVLDQVTGATFLALVVISSIALMVGGIGVMAIMTISVTERTREIGVRKALGARRREILWQFLIEAVFLTAAGGALGIALGSAVGLGVHYLTGFPVSLPWWSFALGIGVSAGVGIFFGIFPAFKASRLDPIEALRYE